jgi:RHS repeat-associated protein
MNHLVCLRQSRASHKIKGTTTTFGYDTMQNRIMKAIITGVDTVFTFYVRDAQGNVLGVYTLTTAGTPTIIWAEQYIYGSGRLGSFYPGIALTATSICSGPHYATTKKLLQGQRRYELSNHLGNVLATINDRRIPRDTKIPQDNIADYYDAVVLSAQDYYPFGMEMPGRTFVLAAGQGSRYGFNGKEKDPTEFSALTHYDYGFRIYNPAIAKFLSVDPLKKDYPELTPYQFASNTPIQAIDLDGLEAWKVIKGVHANGITTIDMVFDAELEPVPGVYEITNYHDESGFIESARWGTANFSDYPDKFPNEGIYERSDGKPLVSFESGLQIITGEIALGVGKFVDVEFGSETNALKFDFDSARPDGEGLQTSSIFDGNDSDRKLKLGGGVALLGAGVEMRKEFDTRMGSFTDKVFAEADSPIAGPIGIKADVTNEDDDSLKFGIPEVKVAAAVGLKFWANVSLNVQKNLTKYEQTLRKANKDVQSGSKLQGTKTNPTE